MGALKVEQSCLECHTTQGYNIGDTMGGLRVSIPIDNYLHNMEIVDSKTELLYLITIFTSLVFILLITYTVNSIYVRELNI